MLKINVNNKKIIVQPSNETLYKTENVWNFIQSFERREVVQSELWKLKYWNFLLTFDEEEQFIKKEGFLHDYSNWVNWSQQNFVRTLFSISSTIAKEVYINRNTIEFKTTNENFELLMWVFKNNSLFQFEQLSELAVIDVPTKFYRFKLNYILFSLRYNTRVIISLKTTEFISISTSSYLYNSAGWLEREVWDLYGIKFHGNNDLRRILTDYGFNGHPLRKDFPLTGFVEIGFNDEYKRILYTPVKLNQAYRVFNLNNPWIKY